MAFRVLCLLSLFAASAVVFAHHNRDEQVVACVRELSVVPAVAREQVSRILREASLSEGATNRLGGCEKSSLEITRVLRDRGVGAERICVHNDLPIRFGRRAVYDVVAHHCFVTIPLRNGRELVVDGTYLQFIDGGMRHHADLVFVGTRDELVEFFSGEQEFLQLSFLGDGLGRLNPEEFVDKHYGYGRASATRVRGDALLR